MGSGRPQPAWSGAVAVTRSLNHDHPVAFREPVHEAVRREVLDQGAVAVNERQRLTGPLLDVVQAHPVHFEKTTDGRVLAFGISRHFGRIQGRSTQGCRRAKQGRYEPGALVRPRTVPNRSPLLRLVVLSGQVWP